MFDLSEINRLSYFQNLNSLKVMLVLYKDNPDVPFEVLLKETKMKSDELLLLLAELIKAELVSIRNAESNKLFTLSQEARMSLNRLNASQLFLGS